MPIYDIVCPVCNEKTEVICRFDDEPLCPKCGAVGARQVSCPSPANWKGDTSFSVSAGNKKLEGK